MKTFAEFNNILYEMSVPSDYDSDSLKGAALATIRDLSSFPNSEEHPKVAVIPPRPGGRSVRYHLGSEGKPHSYSEFRDYLTHHVHQVAHKLSDEGSAGKIRENIVDQHKRFGVPVVGDMTQTKGSLHFWENWKKEEPDKVKLYDLSGGIPKLKDDQTGALGDGNPWTRMGYSEK